MTREIALHCMKSYSELHSDLCELCPIYGQTGSDHCFEDALQYVIGMLEQEPILDKIRAEIETKYGQCDICEYFEDYDYEENDISEYRPIGNIADILQIIDKYKAETEETDGTNKQA